MAGMIDKWLLPKSDKTSEESKKSAKRPRKVFGGNNLSAVLPASIPAAIAHSRKYPQQTEKVAIAPPTTSVGSSSSKSASNKKRPYFEMRELPKIPVESAEEELEDVSLSEAQKRVLDVIMQRKSIFYSGAAGTGKSFILRIVQELFNYTKKSSKLSITATTGIAACNVRGMTIHSWSGVGIGTDSLEQTVAKASRNQQCKKRWQECETLVIDEISMLSAEMFDKISAIGKRCRSDPRPFGGLQVILCGDFFQLPPVGLGKSAHFCFESVVWRELVGGSMIVLDKVFRQRDSHFLRMLNELRRGAVSNATDRLLVSKAENAAAEKAAHESRSLVTTKLFPVNKFVDEYNDRELQKLPVGADSDGLPLNYTYIARDEGDSNMLKGTRAVEIIELRVGAQVMLLKNISTAQGLVNGTRGRVVRFQANPDYDQYSKLEQGMQENLRYFPVIEFITSLAGSTVETFEYEINNSNPSISWIWDVKNGDKVMAARTQIPLMLSWAMSIHKSQGMTIPLLEVSTMGSFEYGQVYVALSRAVSLPGLILTQFSKGAVKAHDTVKAFYHSMGFSVDEEEQVDVACIHTSISELVKSFDVHLPEAEIEDDGWVENAKQFMKSKTPGSSLKGSLSHQYTKQQHNCTSAAANGEITMEELETAEPALRVQISKIVSVRSGSGPLADDKMAQVPAMPSLGGDSFYAFGCIEPAESGPGRKSSVTDLHGSRVSAPMKENTTNELTEEQKRMISEKRVAALARLEESRKKMPGVN